MKALLLAVLVCTAPVYALAATAEWQANTESDLAGYHLYRAPGPCATPGPYALVNTYARTATTGVIANPAIDGPHCHRLSAFDTASNESLFSITVEYTYNVVPPVAPRSFVIRP